MWWPRGHLQVCHGRGDDDDDVQYHGDDGDNVGAGWAPSFKFVMVDIKPFGTELDILVLLMSLITYYT